MILGYRAGIKTLYLYLYPDGIKLLFQSLLQDPFQGHFMVKFPACIESKNNIKKLIWQLICCHYKSTRYKIFRSIYI
jgi:hypothetical protein